MKLHQTVPEQMKPEQTGPDQARPAKTGPQTGFDRLKQGQTSSNRFGTVLTVLVEFAK